VSEAPTLALPHRFFLTGVIKPVSLYLQATVQYAIWMKKRMQRKRTNKPLFPLPLARDRDYGGTPPEELSAPAAEHEAPLGDQQSEGKKKSLTESFVNLYQPFSILSLIFSTFSFGIKKWRIFSNFSA
jgi:hypothetical protein